MLKKIILTFLVLSLNVSCAKMFSSSLQEINFQSSDANKKILANITSGSSGKKIKSTVEIPSKTNVLRSSAPLIIEVDNGNCKSTQMQESRINELTLLNIPLIVFGVFGTTSTAIDFTSGSAWRYDKNITVNTAGSC